MAASHGGPPRGPVRALPGPGASLLLPRTGLEGTPEELQDPPGRPVEVVRRIRDDIDTRVQQLLSELVPAGA